MILFLVFSFFINVPLALTESPPREPLSPLPRLKIEKERITVSGISSGGFFANQMQVAFSSTIRGSAIVAGGVYGCSLGNEKRVSLCMQKAEEVELAEIFQKTKEQEISGLIDSTENLKKAKVFLFFGEKDPVKKKSQLTAISNFYRNYLPDHRIKSVLHPEANHAFPTENYGNTCGKLRLPWISDCDFPLTREFFQLFDSSESPTKVKQHRKNRAEFSKKENPSLLWKKFDQSTLTPDLKVAGLAEWGAIYVPKSCENNSCGLHLAFHGCQMNWQYVQNQFIEKAGYLEAAEENQIVVVFPQLEKTKENPNTCWDWIGSTGPDYLNKNGLQMKAMGNLIEAISSERSGP